MDAMVAVADAAGVDFDEDFAGTGLEHGNIFDFKWLVDTGQDCRLEGLGKGA